MCGLIGMAGTLEHKHKLAMKDLFFLDTLRGRDSTGLTSVKRNRNVLTRKFAVPGYDFIEIPVVDKAMAYGDQVWIGHNRFKTVGDATKENAHPFEVLTEEGEVIIVGAHNGTLENKYELERALNNERYDTDSEALFNLLASEDNYKKAISLLRGAWSLTWWDATTNTLHFCRNDKRPLVYAWTEDHKVLVWASEPWMIINACFRNDVKLAKNNNDRSCYATNPDHLYSLEIPQDRDKVLPDLTRVGGYGGAPERGTFRGGYDQFRSWWDDEWNTQDKDEQKTAAQTKEKGKANSSSGEKEVITLGNPKVKGYKGENLTPHELAAVLDAGCVWCKEPFENKKPFLFIEETAAVCFNCLGDKHPKDGGRVRCEGTEDYLDDPLEGTVIFPSEELDVRPNGVFAPDGSWHQKDSPEYRRLVDSAVASAAKTIG
jgi:predicted glutamine amidotransferase